MVGAVGDYVRFALFGAATLCDFSVSCDRFPFHAFDIPVSLTSYGVPDGGKARQCYNIQAHPTHITWLPGLRLLRGHKTAV